MNAITASRSGKPAKPTKKQASTKRMYASTAANELGVSLPELASLLGRDPETIKPRTPVTHQAITAARKKIKTKPPTPSEGSNSAVSGVGSQVGPAVRVADTMLHKENGRRPRKEDRKIIHDVLLPFVQAYQAVELPFVPDDIRSSASRFTYVGPVTGSTLSLDLGQFTHCQKVGNFPIITAEEFGTMALKLGHLWCVYYYCQDCGGSLNPLLENKLNKILKDQFSLPLIGPPRKRIKFPTRHEECRLMMPKLVAFEVEMRNFSGSNAEGIELRKRQYRSIAVEVLPQVRARQDRIELKDVYRRMFDILKHNKVNH